MRRSAKKRCALRVSWQSLNPKIWMLMFVAGPLARLTTWVACARRWRLRRAKISRALSQRVPDVHGNVGEAERVGATGVGAVIVGAAGGDEVVRTADGA